MASDITRRDFLRESALLGVAAAAALGLERSVHADEQLTLPTVKLGDKEFSRLLMGSNPFWGYAHKPGDVREQMLTYYTDERIMETLDEAARFGITAVVTPPDARWLTLWENYRAKGGKIGGWIAQPHGDVDKMEGEIDRAVNSGVSAAFIQGERADELFEKGDYDRLKQLVEHIRSHEIPAGVASHRSDTHLEYQKRGLPVDFFFQCFYPDDDFLAADREKAVAALKQLEKPVVGYKILAAGRLPAKEGFEFAFKHLAPKDGVCVGVFTKGDPDQVEEDAKLTMGLTT
jgi:hypothetical protein